MSKSDSSADKTMRLDEQPATGTTSCPYCGVSTPHWHDPEALAKRLPESVERAIDVYGASRALSSSMFKEGKEPQFMEALEAERIALAALRARIQELQQEARKEGWAEAGYDEGDSLAETGGRE